MEAAPMRKATTGEKSPRRSARSGCHRPSTIAATPIAASTISHATAGIT